MTTLKPEAVAWGNNPRKMSEADLLPCPNCNHRAGRATKRAAKGLPFVGLWKVSCQRPECPLAMIYFHPVEWNRLPRIRQSDYEALQAECEQWKNSASGAHQQLTANRIETEKLAVDWSKAEAECEKLHKLATECADYLDTNDMTSISHGSILHRKLLDAAMQGDNQ